MQNVGPQQDHANGVCREEKRAPLEAGHVEGALRDCAVGGVGVCQNAEEVQESRRQSWWFVTKWEGGSFHVAYLGM